MMACNTCELHWKWRDELHDILRRYEHQLPPEMVKEVVEHIKSMCDTLNTETLMIEADMIRRGYL
jgi:hypothetical protein